MTSPARYFKFGSENYHAAGNKFRVFAGFDHSRQIIHRRVGLRSIPLHDSGLRLRRSAWRRRGSGSSSRVGTRTRCGEAPVGSVLQMALFFLYFILGVLFDPKQTLGEP